MSRQRVIIADNLRCRIDASLMLLMTPLMNCQGYQYGLD